jgi:hypothetical protein
MRLILKKTNLHIFLVAALYSLTLLTGCMVVPDINTQYDRATNFKTYQSFGWYPTADAPAPERAEDATYSTLIDQRVKEAIASELVKQGLTPITDNPGLLVAYDISIKPAQNVSEEENKDNDYGFGYSHWYGYRFNYGYAAFPDFKGIDKYRIGTLVISLIDKNTNQLVWRGWYEADLDPFYSMVKPRKINRMVANIMSRFPPTPDLTR